MLSGLASGSAGTVGSMDARGGVSSAGHQGWVSSSSLA